jgi:hypothetical protein
MIAAVVGPRTLDTAKEVVAITKARVAGLPAFFSDGFTCYRAALMAAFHVVTTFVRTGKRGRPRKPRCESQPGLVYGHLVKQKKAGQMADAQHARRPGSRTPDVPGLHDQYGLSRASQPDLAPGLGTVGAEDSEFLSRPCAYAAACALFPSLLQCSPTAHEFAAAVAATRAHTPRCDLSSMARAYASHGGRLDRACLDLS